ncbi:SDR family NAD(P)-dependent oxidoreductase [Actinoplanes sp. G11-F43]|uniref:SDR family NAD(P)-dependent oxidoreductase n=1 Tax=Actinoplanes sp. G11-F43 TaxID=3424130 RepID=UPI003D32E8F1
MATIVVTGGSSGVGLAAAKRFAARGDEVILVGRDPDRLATAVAETTAAAKAGGTTTAAKAGETTATTGAEETKTVESFRADFENLAEVRALAASLKGRRIDVLANNAGGMVGEYRRTPDGFEATIQSNHLAPFLLTTLLREELRDARVVNTASRAHMRGVPDPARLQGDPAKYSSWSAYSAAKAANILFAAEAARRWPDVLSVSFHPGVVRTNFGAGRVTRFFYRYAPFLVTPEEAGDLLVWLATAPADRLTNGAYYVGRDKPATPAAHARSAGLAARLWDTSAEAVEE